MSFSLTERLSVANDEAGEDLEEPPFQRVMKNSSGFCVCLPMNSKQRQWLGGGLCLPPHRGRVKCWPYVGGEPPLLGEAVP